MQLNWKHRVHRELETQSHWQATWVSIHIPVCWCNLASPVPYRTTVNTQGFLAEGKSKKRADSLDAFMRSSASSSPKAAYAISMREPSTIPSGSPSEDSMDGFVHMYLLKSGVKSARYATIMSYNDHYNPDMQSPCYQHHAAITKYVRRPVGVCMATWSCSCPALQSQRIELSFEL